MCDMIEVGRINGLAEGTEKGIAIGRAEGKAEGEIKHAIKMVQKLLKSEMPLDSALEFAEIDEKTYNDYKNAFITDNGAPEARS